jgi:hypothetical protein
VTDKPILFSAPMIRALLAGTKTQTRRKLPAAHPKCPQHNILRLDVLSDPQEVWYWDGKHDRVGASYRLPIAPGDRLWVRETVARQETDQGVGYQTYAADGSEVWPLTKWYHQRKTVSCIHMPRWASRLTLTVTDVRVQRVQEISGEDAIAEGACEAAMLPLTDDDAEEARQAFRTLWNSIHDPDAWDQNPWVYALTFDVHRGNIDQMGG